MTEAPPIPTAPAHVEPDVAPRLLHASSGASPAVRLDDVTVNFPGRVVALSSVTFSIERGTHVVVLGASGGGKTTLLGVISGRINPMQGHVTRAGRVATIYQDLRLVKQRTVLANVLDGALGRTGAVRSLLRPALVEVDRARTLLRRVGLTHRIDHPVSKLSGGEQQRVAIARALMQEPVILLADEPVASLDAGNAKAVMRLLSELQRERGLTLVSVLHDCALAETFADRIIGLDGGKMVHDDRACVGAGFGSTKIESTTGLRGFTRFEACRACETIQHSASHLHDPAGLGIDLNSAASSGVKRPWKHVAIAVALLAIYAWAVSGIGVTGREMEGLVGNVVSFIARLVPASGAQWASIDWVALGWSLVSTMQMALVGTTVAVLISWPLAAMAARNVGPRFVRSITRFFLNVVRSVPSLIWALLFVSAVGLGALAGVAALVFYSIGYLTKFFYEHFEAVDPGAPDALREIGAGGTTTFLRAVWPASRAAVLSSSLFMVEYNVRAASVLGVVGAGGIGYDLKLHIDYGNYPVVGAILLMLTTVVLLLDALSSRLRARLTHA